MARLGRAFPANRVIHQPGYVAPAVIIPAFDNSAKVTQGGGGVASGTAFTWTQNVTAGAAGVIAILGAANRNGPQSGSAVVSIGGTSLSAAGFKYFNNVTTSGYIWVWTVNGLTGGSSQTCSVNITQSGGGVFIGYACSFTYTGVTGFGSLLTAASSSTNPSLSVSAAASTDVIWGGFSDSAAVSALSLTNTRQNAASTPFFVLGDETGVTSGTMSATAASGNWCGVALDIQ